MQNYELFTVKCLIHDALNECDYIYGAFYLGPLGINSTFLRSICLLAVYSFARTALRSFVDHAVLSLLTSVLRHLCLFTLMYRVYCMLLLACKALVLLIFTNLFYTDFKPKVAKGSVR